MMQNQLSDLLLNQSKELIWMVNSKFELIYANTAYLSFYKEITGFDKKLNQVIFNDIKDSNQIKKWKSYYKKAFSGESFEVQEDVTYKKSNKPYSHQIVIQPILGENQEIIAVSCKASELQNKELEASELLDQSLDIFCTINEEGNFVYVSEASTNHWGFTPEELIGKAYQDLILEEDLPKTIEAAAAILKGLDVTSFENRYKKKNGEIAYNLWSVKWDNNTKLLYCVSRDAQEKLEQEKVIQLSEQRFKALVQEGSDLILILNQDGTYLYISPTTTTVLGFGSEEHLGMNVAEFIHPEDAEKTLAALKRIKTEKRIEVEPFRFQNSKKEWRWMETVLTNRLDNPAIKGILVNARDITDKIVQEQKIVQSEQRFKALVQEGSDLMTILDVNGNYKYVNPTNKIILGLTPEDYIGKNAFEFIHPEDEKKTLESLKKIITEKRVVVAPYRFLNYQKEWRWIETILTNMLDNPAINGIVSNSRDITDKIKEEEKLRLLESVITNTTESVLITEAEASDESGPKIIFVNEAFTKMTGYTAEEVIGKTPGMLHGPKSDKKELLKLSNAIKNWETCEITVINYKKNGEEFWSNFTVTPIANENGWYTHWIAIERDVTIQKTKEIENEFIRTIINSFHQYNENNLTCCLHKLCEQVVTYCDFDFAEMWLPTIDNKTINLVTNYAKEPKGKAFLDETKELNSFDLGIGIPGYIWKNKEIKIWDNFNKDWNNERKLAAKKTGINTKVGIPLLDDGKVIGVLLLGTCMSREKVETFSRLLQKLVPVLGTQLSRKKLEIELYQIFNFTPDMICVAGFDGYYKQINPAGLELLGYSIEEMISKPIQSFLHPDDRSSTGNQQQIVYNGKVVQNFENRYITKQGKVVWLSWTATSAQEHGIVYAVAKNITEEKRLRELNSQASGLAQIGSWELDLVNQTLFWSPEVHKMHETDPKLFVPNLQTSINFYRKDFRNLVTANLENSIATGKPFDFEAVLVSAYQKELWVRALGTTEFVNGVCTRVYGSFQNIDSVKDTENRLLSFSQNILGVIYQYIIYQDGSDAIQDISGNAKQLWGYTKDEIKNDVDLLWNQIKMGGEIDIVKDSIAIAIKNKSKWQCRFKTVIRNGELKTHLGNGTPTFLTDGSIVFNVMIIDITEEAKNEVLLEQTTSLARIGSWELDLLNQEDDGMYWSPLLYEILELDSSYKPTLTGGIEFHIGESKERLKKCLELLISDGVPFDEEIELITAKGNRRWNRAIGKSEMINGKRSKIYGSFQDIHKSKMSELELIKAKEKAEASDAKFKAYTEQSTISIYTTNTDGDCIYANETWLKMAGMTMSEAKGKGWINALHPDDYKQVQNNWYKSVKSHGKWSYEYRFINKDGKINWVNGTAKQLYNEANELIGYLGSNINITDQKKAEQEKYNLQKTLENSLNEIYIFDAATLKFTYANNSALRNLGYSEKEILKLSPFIIKPDYTEVQFKELVSTLISKEEKKIVFFTNHQRKDKSIYPVEVHLQLVTEDNNKRFLAVVLDITQRKKAQADIIDSEERRRLIMNGALDAIITIDVEEKITFWNPKAEVIFGWKESEVLGKPLSTLIVPEPFRKFHIDGINNYILSGNSKILNVLLELSAVNRNGDEFPIELTVIPIKQSGDMFFCAFIRDITLRKKAEENIIISNERFEKVTQATNDVIWDWDIANKVFHRSNAIERFFGENATKKIVNSDFWKDGFHPEDAAKIEESIENAILDSAKERWEFEYRIFNENGEMKYVIDRGLIIRNKEGKAIRMVGSMTDISEQKQLTLELGEVNQSLQKYALELERSNEELEQFAYVASHDLQEPLRMISSFMEQLKRKYGNLLDEKALQYIFFATDGAQRMKQIILDLLEYSKASKPKEGKENVNVTDIITEYKLLRRKLISEKKVSITFDSLPILHIQKAALVQIFHCLLDNAIKYSKQDIHPILEISAKENKTEWEFSIQDNGIGIDKEYFDKIFLIFQRLHQKEEYAGTGIGLSIVKRHIEFLGGRIWLQSVINEGTTFYFTIPKVKQ
jgi:PAS domain S-box-containing protein